MNGEEHDDPNTDAPAPEPEFRVTAPRLKPEEKPYTGKRLGLEFKGGIATTKNPITAHAALEFGCQVTDLRTNTPAFGSDDADAVKRIEANAKANW